MRFNSPAAEQKSINDAERARAAGLTLTSLVAMPFTFPGLP
jgi:hypothetical protein